MVKKLESVKKPLGDQKVQPNTSFKDYLNIYEFEVILPGSGQGLIFKPIITGELKKLLVYEQEKDDRVIEKALDELISSSVISEGFDINDLYLQDRFFLLVELRKRSKGELYKFTFACPQCKSQVMQSVDLNSLEIKLPPESVDPHVELSDNIAVTLKHITRHEQMEAHKEFDSKGLSPLQRRAELALLSDAAGIEVVITPSGEEKNLSISDRKFLLESIPVGSYERIKEWHISNGFGLDFNFNIVCGNCGYDEKMEIPLDNFFF